VAYNHNLNKFKTSWVKEFSPNSTPNLSNFKIISLNDGKKELNLKNTISTKLNTLITGGISGRFKDFEEYRFSFEFDCDSLKTISHVKKIDVKKKNREQIIKEFEKEANTYNVYSTNRVFENIRTINICKYKPTIDSLSNLKLSRVEYTNNRYKILQLKYSYCLYLYDQIISTLNNKTSELIDYKTKGEAHNIYSYPITKKLMIQNQKDWKKQIKTLYNTIKQIEYSGSGSSFNSVIYVEKHLEFRAEYLNLVLNHIS
jgi:isochorismate synthase EntC